MTKLVNFEYLTVLVIEDSSFMRRTLNKLLSGFGFKNVLETDNAAEGLKMLQQFNVDLILLDLEMDPIDGIEFTKMMRTSPDTADPLIPIILITGHTERYRIFAARDAGVNEVLAKPVSSNDLLSRIMHVFQTPRPFAEGGGFFGPDRRRKSDKNYQGEDRRAGVNETESALSQDEVEALLG